MQYKLIDRAWLNQCPDKNTGRNSKSKQWINVVDVAFKYPWGD